MGLQKGVALPKASYGRVSTDFLPLYCSYNKERDDFDSADAYNEYLEKREEMSKSNFYRKGFSSESH